jgi:ATP-dependent RNA helicase RhlE
MRKTFTKRTTFHKRRFSKPSFELAKAIKEIQIVSKAQLEPVKQEVYVPKNGFKDFPLSDILQENITYKGYTEMTPIQDQAIMHILEGRDVIGIANTGTGKTAAFLIPLIDKVFHNKNERVLIITPTRELALQIHEELHSFSKGLGIRTSLCIGGMSLQRQRNELRQNINFVIGTPGRIKDLVQSRFLNLSGFNNVVLDEADRMVDIGFINEIKYFINLLPKQRQSLFFSATISPKVKEILQAFVNNPITISVKQEEIVKNIDQNVIRVTDRSKKIGQLTDLLKQDGFDKILIFGRTKWGVQKLTDNLLDMGFKAGAIHGNKNQNQRQKVLEKFKNNEIKILLATDVASRGLDIDDVSHVINYDLPATYEDYIHRIGRTGRANKKGIALTFIE